MFGVDATVAAGMNSSGIKMSGSITNLSIGPLHLTSANGTGDPSFDFEMGVMGQTVDVDGGVGFYGMNASMLVHFKGGSQPSMTFSCHREFTSQFLIEIMGSMIGGLTDLTRIQDVDFQLSVVFEQNILAWIEQTVDDTLKGIIGDVAETDGTWIKSIQYLTDKIAKEAQPAQDALAAAIPKWEAIQKEVNDKETQMTQDWQNKLATAKQAVIDSKAAFDAATSKAQAALTQATVDGDAQVRTATNAFNAASVDMANKVDDAQVGPETRQIWTSANGRTFTESSC